MATNEPRLANRGLLADGHVRVATWVYRQDSQSWRASGVMHRDPVCCNTFCEYELVVTNTTWLFRVSSYSSGPNNDVIYQHGGQVDYLRDPRDPFEQGLELVEQGAYLFWTREQD